MPTMSTAKPRCDAWDADLDEAARWRIYAQARRSPWYEVTEWIAAEYGIMAPSRSALYAWLGRMREMESAHRIEQALQARAEIGALAGTAASGDRLIAAYQSMAAELALRGNAPDAVRLTTMAMQLAAQQTAEAELEIKQRRLDQQQDALRLEREKFEAAEARLAATRQAVETLGHNGALSADARAMIEQAMGIL